MVDPYGFKLTIKTAMAVIVAEKTYRKFAPTVTLKPTRIVDEIGLPRMGLTAKLTVKQFGVTGVASGLFPTCLEIRLVCQTASNLDVRPAWSRKQRGHRVGRKRLFNDKTKWCRKCEKWLVLSAFGLNKRTASGRSYYCRTCHNTYCGTFWTKVHTYDAFLEREYHMHPGQYLDLWRAQDKKCPICDLALVLYNRKTLVDFRDGRVHGLLCADCMEGLKKLKISPELLAKAIQYLKPISMGVTP